MNALSLQSLAQVDPVAEARARAEMWGTSHGTAGMGRAVGLLMGLPASERRRVAERAVSLGVAQGLSDLRAMGMHLGQDAMSAVVAQALQPLLPALGEQLMNVVGPAAQKAADVVGPVLEEKLKKWGPIIGIIAGAIAALLGIFGMFVVGQYVVRKVA